MNSLAKTVSLLLALAMGTVVTSARAEDDHSTHSGGKGKGSHQQGGGHTGGQGNAGHQGSGYTHDSHATGSKSVEKKIFESGHGKGPKYMGGGKSGGHTDHDDTHDSGTDEGDEHSH